MLSKESSIENGHLSAEYIKESNNKNEEPITKVLMNPPFALKTSDEKEYKFIDHALKQIEDGEILFSILPSSVMVKGGIYMNWRHRLLEKHTLLSAITFPDDLFYPIGVHTLGVFIKKGAAHQRDDNVLWVRAINDG